MLKLPLAGCHLLYSSPWQWLEIEIAYCYRDGSDQLRFAIQDLY